jgi:hypothetical protein
MSEDWPKKPHHWIQDGREHISVAFTWDLPSAYQYCVVPDFERKQKPIVGGPAVKLIPDYLQGVAEIGGDIPGVLQKINPRACRFSTGCIRGCGFCAVPITEGAFRELPIAHVGPLVCDNNLLACSRRHFDRVIDVLKPLREIDFNQGLDARLLTNHHASQLAELDATIRLAWDNVNSEPQVMRAVETLMRHGIPADRIRCYVLIGYRDTPEEALYRVRTLSKMGILPNVQRYVPLYSLVKRYTDTNGTWTHKELTWMSRYWNNLQRVGNRSYEEWCEWQAAGRPDPNPSQMPLLEATP